MQIKITNASFKPDIKHANLTLNLETNKSTLNYNNVDYDVDKVYYDDNNQPIMITLSVESSKKLYPIATTPQLEQKQNEWKHEGHGYSINIMQVINGGKPRGLAALTVKQLIERCKKKGIPYSRKRKEDLIKALRTKRRSSSA